MNLEEIRERAYSPVLGKSMARAYDQSIIDVRNLLEENERISQRVTRLSNLERRNAKQRDEARARLAAVEKLHGKYPIYDTAFACADRTERHSQEAHMEVDGIIVCTDLPLYAVCAQCRDEEGFHTINWPCDTIKAVRGD